MSAEEEKEKEKEKEKGRVKSSSNSAPMASVAPNGATPYVVPTATTTTTTLRMELPGRLRRGGEGEVMF